MSSLLRSISMYFLCAVMTNLSTTQNYWWGFFFFLFWQRGRGLPVCDKSSKFLTGLCPFEILSRRVFPKVCRGGGSLPVWKLICIAEQLFPPSPRRLTCSSVSDCHVGLHPPYLKWWGGISWPNDAHDAILSETMRRGKDQWDRLKMSCDQFIAADLSWMWTMLQPLGTCVLYLSFLISLYSALY